MTHPRSPSSRARLAAAVTALALGAAAPGAPLAAQGASGGTSCGEGCTRVETRARRQADDQASRERIALELRAAIDRARLALDRAGDVRDPAMMAAFREASRTLQQLQARPADPAFAEQMRRLDALTEQHLEMVHEDAQFRMALKDAVRLQEQYTRAGLPRAQRPIGWLGVSYSSEMQRIVRDGEQFAIHRDYPAVLSVEPGSPAERAGLRRGDTIIAYNRQDLRQREVSLSKLLVPEERMVVTVRRDGRRVDVPVVVGYAPGRARAPGAPTVTWCFEGECRVVAAGSAPRRPGTPPTPPPPAPPATPATPAPEEWVRVVPVAPRVYGTSTASAIAGATIVSVDENLREVLGTEPGLLVSAVAESSPAHRAGLLSGDVIVRAGGRRVTSPQALREAVARAANREGASSIELEVTRKGKSRKVTLGWRDWP